MKNGWRKIKIKDFCEITSSKRIYASEYQTEGIPFYRGKEISEKYNGKLDVSTELFISPDKYSEIKYKFGIPETGDLLLTSVGTLGVPYIVKENEVFYFKDGNLTWFRKFKDIDSRFLFYWIVSPSGKAQLKKSTIGSSQSAYTIVLLKEMEVEIPPVSNQCGIASILSAYDDLIENNTRRIKILEEMARLIYREWFVEFKAFGIKMRKATPEEKKVTGKDVFPEGWEMKPFTDLADVLSGGTPKTSKDEYWNGSLAWFTPRDIGDSIFVIDTERKITQVGLDHCNSKLFPKGTIFITARGTVGNVVITAIPMAMSQTNYALIGKRDIPQTYIYHSIMQQVEKLQKGATGAVFDTIIVDTFRKLSVIKPDNKVLLAFDEKVSKINEMILVLLKQNVNLRQTRDLLLPKLISGEVDV